jgi:2-hydroxyacyl-CoA lyase 1
MSADIQRAVGWCRLNWQLHFGEPPKWSRGVRFILVDPEPSERDAQKAEVVLRGDAAAVALQLQRSLHSLDSSLFQRWRSQLAEKVRLQTVHQAWEAVHD